MKRLACVAILIICCGATRAMAVSAVFNGDPINPASGLPYEIAPGFPLVLPGPDGVLGTADDVVDSAIIGDIDMVVRSGSPAATSVIPPPTIVGGRGAVPVGVAGSTVSGGVEVPFTVFLSDGVTSSAAPSGHLLPAADMDGIPVLVAAFGDLDGDGFIGPTGDPSPPMAALQIRELEPVGRAVALFSSGVARGSIAVHAGSPARDGGLSIALTAMALTGPFDPTFFGGNVPSGPAISTALPFVPQRDLTRLIRDRAVPAAPNSTLQQVIQFAAVPSVASGAPFALPLNGSSPTIDVAVVDSQAAVRAAFQENARPPTLRHAVDDIVLGTTTPANARQLRLAATDRWGNPADVSGGFAVTLRATPPLRIVQPHAARRGLDIPLHSTFGVRVTIKVPPGTPQGTSGTLVAERAGVIVGALAYHVDARVNRPAPDITVPSNQAATIGQALAQASDVNQDGTVVVEVKPGLYRENVAINRPLLLHGDGAGTTVVEGDGTTGVLSITAAGTTVEGITAVGGTAGFAVDAPSGTLIDVRAWRNLHAGVAINGSDTELWRSEARENGGDGVLISAASATICTDGDSFDNGGAGINVTAASNGLVDSTRLSGNAGGGINLASVTGTTVTDNASVQNIGAATAAGGGASGGGGGTDTGGSAGISLSSSQSNQILNNLSALNDDDGVHLDTTSGNLISGNVIDTNQGYGLFVRRSTNDDFASTTGVQAPPGDNSVSNNRKGDVFVSTPGGGGGP